MTRTPPPTDGLDAALSDFFRSEMPKPWPAAPALATVPTRRDPGRRARLTLAASVALLAAGCWLLSGGGGGGPAGGAKPGAPADVLQNATARHPAATDKAKAKAAATTDPMNGFPQGALPMP
ncbi:hypothetical protein [Urbifossiella limnaea]|uniref:Uncharacterized protein n=1 Tax=Urbifossiella limnaea TaxID=2528023 RepID=A0A517XMM4_9BACT|nr:hypothetical protein [Urbifossiella limnaea]QDU18748.1 hypothetical protein ETAA1_06440 [Urbifossiella limnaea]